MTKIDEFKIRMPQYDPHIILLTETWLHESIPDSLIHLPGYSIFRNDRYSSKGGGACIFVKQEISGHKVNCKTIENDKYRDLRNTNLVHLEIKIEATKFEIVCIYRPGSIDRAENSMLLEVLETIFSADCPVLCLGDFNYPEIDWATLTLTQNIQDSDDFLQLYKELSASQMITFPTRIRNGESSLLDLLLVNDENLITSILEEPPFGLSDHVTVLTKIQLKISEKATKTVFKRNFWKASYDQVNNYFVQAISNYKPYNPTSAECEIFKQLEETINNAIEKYIPLSAIRVNRHKPWISHQIFKEIKLKRKKWATYRRSKNEIDYAAYRLQNNRVKNIITQARKMYEQTIISSCDKKFYTYIKRLLNSKVSILELKHETTNDLITDPTVIAETFAAQFNSVFTKDNVNNIPLFQQGTRCQSSLVTVQFTPDEVKKSILSLKTDSSSGPDDIPSIFLHKCVDSLSEIFVLAMNESLAKGIIPKKWSEAVVIPIFKKGNRFIPANYRPISLTCNTSKSMEKIIAKTVTDFMLDNAIIPKSQHGFLPQRSTTSNLLSCFNDWSKMHDEGQPVDVIYLDFEKAFDKVSHKKLISKLENFGIRGTLLRWLESFITNRFFKVRANGAFSSSYPVLSGVPQGSVLGPLLFIIYISDLAKSMKTTVSFFADDTKLYCNPNTSYRDLKTDLKTIEKWTDTWSMSLNPDKCTILHIGSNNLKLQYKLNSTELSKVEWQRDLGIIISSDLKWEKHINRIVKQANTTLYLSLKAFKDHSKNNVLKIYKSFIRPKLEYCHSLWSPYFVKDIECLERLQRKITRIPPEISDLPYKDRLTAMNLQPLQLRRQRGDLIEAFKIINGHYSCNLDILHRNISIRHLRGHSKKFEKEKCSKLVRKNFLTNRLVYQWNNLKEETVSAVSINSFKNRLDEELANQDQEIQFIHYTL